MTRESMPKPNIEDNGIDANRPRGQTTEGWRKPSEEELTRNPKMRSDTFIPATPTSLMSNGLEIPPTPQAKEVINE